MRVECFCRLEHRLFSWRTKIARKGTGDQYQGDHNRRREASPARMNGKLSKDGRMLGDQEIYDVSVVDDKQIKILRY